MLEALWRDAEELGLFTDASLEGFGAIFIQDGKAEAFGGSWAQYGVDTSTLSINELEMLAVAMACDRWGAQLSRRRVVMRCDNDNCVSAINSQRCTADALGVGLRELTHQCMRHSFDVRSRHIPTAENVLADSLSRIAINPRYWREFYDFALSEFDLEPDDITMVEPTLTLDVAHVLTRMVRAEAAVPEAEREKRRRRNAKAAERRRRKTEAAVAVC
jgi:hypothetical protein